MTKYEQDTLNKISSLNEGILGTIARMFATRALKSKYRKVYKVAKDDPELLAALGDLEGYHERVQDILKSFCKRHPNNKRC